MWRSASSRGSRRCRRRANSWPVSLFARSSPSMARALPSRTAPGGWCARRPTSRSSSSSSKARSRKRACARCSRRSTACCARTPRLAPTTSRSDTPLHAPGHVLPDVLTSGLTIVFCGTAAGTVSAARGAYYAHPQNKFWSALEAVRLTPRLLRPEEYAELPQWGLGLTDIAKHVSGMDRELPQGALGREACAELEAKIRAAEPKLLAFTSLTAGRRYLGRAAVFGEQPERIGVTRVWILPSPSPTAGWNWEKHKHWWRMLADEARS